MVREGPIFFNIVISQQLLEYADLSCIGCKLKEESGEELLICEYLSKENSDADNPITYDLFYSSNVVYMVKAGLVMQNALKERQRIIEAGVTWNRWTQMEMELQPRAPSLLSS